MALPPILNNVEDESIEPLTTFYEDAKVAKHVNTGEGLWIEGNTEEVIEDLVPAPHDFEVAKAHPINPERQVIADEARDQVLLPQAKD